jgi:hypothetical protein
VATESKAPQRTAGWLPLVLCLVGAWTIVVPYLGHAIGLEVNVASRVEIVDHVVPGAAVIAGSAGALLYERRKLGDPGDLLPVAGVALAFLAAFWVTATHVPLLAEAARGETFFKVYRQYKMYNDPKLNPAIYGEKR